MDVRDEGALFESAMWLEHPDAVRTNRELFGSMAVCDLPMIPDAGSSTGFRREGVRNLPGTRSLGPVIDFRGHFLCSLPADRNLFSPVRFFACLDAKCPPK